MNVKTKDNRKRIAVVVDPYTSGVFFVSAFKALNIFVVGVVTSLKPPTVYQSSYQPELLDQIINADEGYECVVNTLSEYAPICIVAGCESGVELTDRLLADVLPEQSNRLSLANARRHKGAMGEAIVAAGLAAIKQIYSNDHNVVKKWLKMEGLYRSDLIIKPPKSAGTDSVTRVRLAKNWKNVFNDMLGSTNRLGIQNTDILVQEYVLGTEYVIDTFSQNGEHSICDICEYSKIDNGDYIAIYDKMTWLSPDAIVYSELVDYAKSVIDAVGLVFGTAHIEVMMTDNGPKLIEIGARPHGGGHPEFCRLATGDSQVDRAVRYFSNGEVPPESYELLTNLQVVFLISKRTGYVQNAEILDRIKRLKSFHTSKIAVRNGDFVEPTKDLFGSQSLGFIILRSKSKNQIDADYLKIRMLENRLSLTSELNT